MGFLLLGMKGFLVVVLGLVVVCGVWEPVGALNCQTLWDFDDGTTGGWSMQSGSSAHGVYSGAKYVTSGGKSLELQYVKGSRAVFNGKIDTSMDDYPILAFDYGKEGPVSKLAVIISTGSDGNIFESALQNIDNGVYPPKTLYFDTRQATWKSGSDSGTTVKNSGNVKSISIVFQNPTEFGFAYVDTIRRCSDGSTPPTPPPNPQPPPPPSDMSQYVRTCGNKFCLGSCTYYFSGTNCYPLIYLSKSEVTNFFKLAKNSGFEVVRAWGFMDAYQNGVQFQTKNGASIVQLDGPNGIERLDFVLDEARKAGVRLILPLVNNWDQFGGLPIYRWWLGYPRVEDFYTNNAAKTAFKKWLEFVITRTNKLNGYRYNEDPTIFAWELTNEARCQGCSVSDTNEWIKLMTNYIRQYLDSNHMIAIGDEGFYSGRYGQESNDWPYTGSQGMDFESSLSFPNVDFGTIHIYNDQWGRSVNPWGTNWIRDHINTQNALNKPVILEEYGGYDNNRVEIFNAYQQVIEQENLAGDLFWMLKADNNNADGYGISSNSIGYSTAVNHAAAMRSKNTCTGGSYSPMKRLRSKDNVSWKSSLFPDDWTPKYRDSKGRFLHDFSTAGYHLAFDNVPDSSTPIPGRIWADVTADPSFIAGEDSTRVIQKMIDSVGSGGGGVVYLPAGTYFLSPQREGDDYCLRISYNNVIIRGDSSQTTFLVASPGKKSMRNVAAVLVSGKGDWYSKTSDSVPLASDAKGPTYVIKLENVKDFKEGDWIVIRSDVTKEFLRDYNAEDYWDTDSDLAAPVTYRKVLAVDPIDNTLTLDIPSRYPLKRAHNARVHKIRKHLSEVGIESLSIGMNMPSNLDTSFTWKDGDYKDSSKPAYFISGSAAIRFQATVHSWVTDVKSFSPSSNGWHLLSNGIILHHSRSITINQCDLQSPFYKGDGLNGYGYLIMGSDNLVRDSQASSFKMNANIQTMAAHGNVFVGTTLAYGSNPSGFEQQLAFANLFDSTRLIEDSLAATPHSSIGLNGVPKGPSSTEAVFWNTQGSSNSKFVIESKQAGYGYVIGVDSRRVDVELDSKQDANTAPEDFTELGSGSDLDTPSLFLAQLNRRFLLPLMYSPKGDRFFLSDFDQWRAVESEGSAWKYSNDELKMIDTKSRTTARHLVWKPSIAFGDDHLSIISVRVRTPSKAHTSSSTSEYGLSALVTGSGDNLQGVMLVVRLGRGKNAGARVFLVVVRDGEKKYYHQTTLNIGDEWFDTTFNTLSMRLQTDAKDRLTVSLYVNNKPAMKDGVSQILVQNAKKLQSSIATSGIFTKSSHKPLFSNFFIQTSKTIRFELNKCMSKKAIKKWVQALVPSDSFEVQAEDPTENCNNKKARDLEAVEAEISASNVFTVNIFNTRFVTAASSAAQLQAATATGFGEGTVVAKSTNLPSSAAFNPTAAEGKTATISAGSGGGGGGGGGAAGGGGGGGLSGGAIAGAVVGSVLGAVLIVGVIIGAVVLVKRKDGPSRGSSTRSEDSRGESLRNSIAHFFFFGHKDGVEPPHHSVTGVH